MLVGLAKITWGPSFGNTLWIPYADNAVSYTEPGEDWEWLRAPSGFRDAWVGGEDGMLALDHRWIPTVNTSDPLATGWDGAAGVRAFLSWARGMNPYRVYPDARNLHARSALATDTNGDGVADGYTIWANAGSAFAIEGGAQRVTLASSIGGNLAGLYPSSDAELSPVAPGCPYFTSIEVKLAPTAAVGVRVYVEYLTTGFALVPGSGTYHTVAVNPTLPDFTRLGLQLPTVPASAARVRLRWNIYDAAGGAANGSHAWFRRIQLEQGSAFTSYVDSESFVSSYLVQPLKGEPSLESDGTRRLRLVSATTTTGTTYDAI